MPSKRVEEQRAWCDRASVPNPEYFIDSIPGTARIKFERAGNSLRRTIHWPVSPDKLDPRHMRKLGGEHRDGFATVSWPMGSNKMPEIPLKRPTSAPEPGAWCNQSSIPHNFSERHLDGSIVIFRVRRHPRHVCGGVGHSQHHSQHQAPAQRTLGACLSAARARVPPPSQRDDEGQLRRYVKREENDLERPWKMMGAQDREAPYPMLKRRPGSTPPMKKDDPKYEVRIAELRDWCERNSTPKIRGRPDLKLERHPSWERGEPTLWKCTELKVQYSSV